MENNIHWNQPITFCNGKQHSLELTNHILQWKTTFTGMNQSYSAMETNIHWNQPITFCNGKHHSLESTNHILQWKNNIHWNQPITFCNGNQHSLKSTNHILQWIEKLKESANNILKQRSFFLFLWHPQFIQCLLKWLVQFFLNKIQGLTCIGDSSVKSLKMTER